MDYKELIETLKNIEAIAYGYNINGEVLGMDCSEFEQIIVDAFDSITDLLARTEAAEARAEKAERERDAAVFDLLRAEEAAEETNALLDDEVHPACDYSLYLAVHDSVSDIVNWEHDDVWRSHKEEKE